jgi:hypothetical protein
MPTPLISALAGIIAIVAVVLAGVAIAADDTGPDLEPRLAELQSQSETTQETLTKVEDSLAKAQLVATLNSLDAVGFHDIDDELQAASEIPAGALGSIRMARQVAVSTAWPEDLKEQSDALVASLQEMETALDGDDLETAKGAATEVHDAFHELEHHAYPFLAGEEPPAEEGEHGG